MEVHFGFLLILEGDKEEHKLESIAFKASALAVKYWNVWMIPTQRCVLDSAALGLYYLGFQQLAVLIASSKNNSAITLNPMGYLQELIVSKTTKEEQRQLHCVVLGN
jgi:hypothetical protein